MRNGIAIGNPTLMCKDIPQTKQILKSRSCTISRCTMYSVHCTLYNLLCTMSNVQCTMSNLQCTLYAHTSMEKTIKHLYMYVWLYFSVQRYPSAMYCTAPYGSLRRTDSVKKSIRTVCIVLFRTCSKQQGIRTVCTELHLYRFCTERYTNDMYCTAAVPVLIAWYLNGMYCTASVQILYSKVSERYVLYCSVY